MRPVPSHCQRTRPTSLGIGSNHSRRPEHCSISIKDSVHTSTFETKISKTSQVRGIWLNPMVFKQRKTERQRDEFQAKRSGKTTTQCWPRAKTLPWWSSRRRWAMPTNEVLEPAMMEPTQGHEWDPRNSPCVAINPCWALGGSLG